LEAGAAPGLPPTTPEDELGCAQDPLVAPQLAPEQPTVTTIHPHNDRYLTLHALAYALLTYALIPAAGGDTDTVTSLAGLLAAYGPLIPRP